MPTSWSKAARTTTTSESSALEPVVATSDGCDAVLHEQSEELQGDVRDDLDVHPRVVVDLEAEDGVDVRDVPPRLDLWVRVDVLEDASELAVPAGGESQVHRRDRLRGRESRVDDDFRRAQLDDVVRLAIVSHAVSLEARRAHGAYCDLGGPVAVQARVRTGPGDQLVVRAHVDDVAVVEHDDDVRAADRRQAVRDDERRSSGQEAAESAIDPPLGADVHGRRRLVEDEDPRVGEQRARKGDELALAERELEAALADRGVVAVRRAPR